VVCCGPMAEVGNPRADPVFITVPLAAGRCEGAAVTSGLAVRLGPPTRIVDASGHCDCLPTRGVGELLRSTESAPSPRSGMEHKLITGTPPCRNTTCGTEGLPSGTPTRAVGHCVVTLAPALGVLLFIVEETAEADGDTVELPAGGPLVGSAERKFLTKNVASSCLWARSNLLGSTLLEARSFSSLSDPPWRWKRFPASGCFGHPVPGCTRAVEPSAIALWASAAGAPLSAYTPAPGLLPHPVWLRPTRVIGWSPQEVPR